MSHDLSKFEDITIEPCVGETYCEPEKVGVYGHFRYPEHSVLAGQWGRAFLDSFDSVEEAMVAYPMAEDSTGSSSHVPVDDMTRHLPGEEWDDAAEWPLREGTVGEVPADEEESGSSIPTGKDADDADELRGKGKPWDSVAESFVTADHVKTICEDMGRYTPPQVGPKELIEEVMEILESHQFTTGDLPLAIRYVDAGDNANAYDILWHEFLQFDEDDSDREWQWLNGSSAAECQDLLNQAIQMLGYEPISDDPDERERHPGMGP